MADLSGKLAVVSGATGGIGKAVAAALAQQGATVAIVGRSDARISDAMRDIRASVPAGKPGVQDAFYYSVESATSLLREPANR